MGEVYFLDIWGTDPKLLPHYFAIAKILGKEVHWIALGVYESTPNHVLKALKLSMGMSDYVSVRDPISKKVLNDMGIEKAKLVPDAATTLLPNSEAGNKRLVEAGIDLDKPILGVAARQVKNADNNMRLQKAYQGVIEEFLEREWQIVLLPFGNHPFEQVEMDHKVCQEYSDEYGISIPEFNTPQEMIGIIKQLYE